MLVWSVDTQYALRRHSHGLLSPRLPCDAEMWSPSPASGHDSIRRPALAALALWSPEANPTPWQAATWILSGNSAFVRSFVDLEEAASSLILIFVSF